MGLFRSKRARWAVALLPLMAAACGDSPSSPTPPPPPPPPALTLTCPAAQSGLSLNNQPVTITWDAPTAAGGTAPVQIGCTPPSGSAFTEGVSQVTCTGIDAANARATCGFAVTITRPPQVSVTRMLAFGDSITWGTDAPPATLFFYTASAPGPPPPTSYPSQLQGLLASRYVDQTFTMVNEGWPGEPIATGLKRLPGVVSLNNPEVFLLLHGANDLLGKPSSATTEYIATKLTEMVRVAKQRAPAVKVLLALFPPQYHGTVPYDRGKGAEFVPELNQRIAAVAQREGAILVDLYTPLVPNLKQNIGTDGLHPTIQGYTLMAETFNEVIQRNFEVRRTLW